MVLLVCVMPFAGLLSDKTGRRPVLLTAVLGMGITVYPLFLLIDRGDPLMVFVAQCVFAIWVGAPYMVSTYLIKRTGNMTAPAVYLIILELVGLPAYILLRAKKSH